MTTTVKAEAIMRKVRDVFTRLMPTYVFTAGVDSDGFPTLYISQSSTPVAGQQNILIRVKPDNLFFKNAIESSQENFCPHSIETSAEGYRASEFDPGVTYSVLTALNEMKMHGALAKAGCSYKFYIKPGGTGVPSLADFVTANMQFIVNPSIYDLEVAQ